MAAEDDEDVRPGNAGAATQERTSLLGNGNNSNDNNNNNSNAPVPRRIGLVRVMLLCAIAFVLLFDLVVDVAEVKVLSTATPVDVLPPARLLSPTKTTEPALAAAMRLPTHVSAGHRTPGSSLQTSPSSSSSSSASSSTTTTTTTTSSFTFAFSDHRSWMPSFVAPLFGADPTTPSTPSPTIDAVQLLLSASSPPSSTPPPTPTPPLTSRDELSSDLAAPFVPRRRTAVNVESLTSMLLPTASSPWSYRPYAYDGLSGLPLDTAVRARAASQAGVPRADWGSMTSAEESYVSGIERIATSRHFRIHAVSQFKEEQRTGGDRWEVVARSLIQYTYDAPGMHVPVPPADASQPPPVTPATLLTPASTAATLANVRRLLSMSSSSTTSSSSKKKRKGRASSKSPPRDVAYNTGHSYVAPPVAPPRPAAAAIVAPPPPTPAPLPIIKDDETAEERAAYARDSLNPLLVKERATAPVVYSLPRVVDFHNGTYDVDLTTLPVGRYNLEIRLVYSVSQMNLTHCGGRHDCTWQDWDLHAFCKVEPLAHTPLSVHLDAFAPAPSPSLSPSPSPSSPSSSSSSLTLADYATSSLSSTSSLASLCPSAIYDNAAVAGGSVPGGAPAQQTQQPVDAGGVFAQARECRPPLCTGDIQQLTSARVVYRPSNCYLHVYTPREAEQCLLRRRTRRVLLLGDSITSVLFHTAAQFFARGVAGDDAVFASLHYYNSQRKWNEWPSPTSRRMADDNDTPQAVEIRYEPWKFDYRTNATNVAEIEQLLAWADVVLMNSGMHDLAQRNLWEKDLGVSERAHPQAEYVTAAREVLQWLAQLGNVVIDKVVWMSIVAPRRYPSAAKCFGQRLRPDRIEFLNENMVQLMNAAGIPYIDLYSVTRAMDERWFYDHIHLKSPRSTRDDVVSGRGQTFASAAERWNSWKKGQTGRGVGERNEKMLLQTVLNHLCN
jgi:hypothetical protein